MNSRILWAIVHGVLLLAVLFGAAVLANYWAIPLALTSTAYYLVFAPNYPISSPEQVVVSHLLALLVGWGTHLVVAPGVTPTAVEPLSGPALRIVLSTLIAYAIITGFFVALDVRRSMAYVTAFAAALGVFSTLRALTIAALAVLLMAGIQTLCRELGPEFPTRPVL